MSTFRFVHAADLHLDSPFQGLYQTHPDIASVLKEATFKAFSEIIDLCIERHVDFLVIAGDVYDSADSSLRAQLRFRDELRRLTEHDISAYVIHGNHDPLDGWRARVEWPEKVYFFHGEGVERVLYQRGEEPIAAIYGISYQHREVKDNLARQYQHRAEDPFSIGLLHANVGGDPGHETYAPCSLEDLVENGMDYWALGHIHKRAILHDRAPTVVYAGNPQGRHPNEDGARGCMLVEVEDGEVENLEFVDTDSVRWIEEMVSIEALESEQAFIDRLEACCLELTDAAEGRSLVCRLRIEGRGPLYRMLRKRGTEEFTEHLREQLAGEQPFIWVDRIEDRTRPDIDIEARLQGEDFVGDFLRIVQRYKEEPEKLMQLRAQLAPLFEHRLGRKYLEMLSAEELSVLLDEAQHRCLDHMVEEGR